MSQRHALILASQSAARAALLRGAGLVFEPRPAHIDEAAIKTAAQAQGADPAEAALTLARRKAARVEHPDAIVIGADQLLVCEGAWFDKPATLDAARTQLRTLRGRPHELVTAVTCMRGGTELWRHVARPRLVMRNFSDGFLDAYLAMEGEAVLASVGCYRLEGPGVQLFDHIEGEYSAILGLPLLPLLRFLRGIQALLD